MNCRQIFLPNPQKSVEQQEPLVLLGMCVWGEARGEPREAKSGVAWVVMNRVANPGWWGRDLVGVILHPWQFSSFNRRDPNRGKLLSPLKWDRAEVWDECYATACDVEQKLIPDPTGGADHYFDNSITPPRWADPRKRKAEIGNFKFYRIQI